MRRYFGFKPGLQRTSNVLAWLRFRAGPRSGTAASGAFGRRVLVGRQGSNIDKGRKLRRMTPVVVPCPSPGLVFLFVFIFAVTHSGLCLNFFPADSIVGPGFNLHTTRRDSTLMSVALLCSWRSQRVVPTSTRCLASDWPSGRERGAVDARRQGGTSNSIPPVRLNGAPMPWTENKNSHIDESQIAARTPEAQIRSPTPRPLSIGGSPMAPTR